MLIHYLVSTSYFKNVHSNHLCKLWPSSFFVTKNVILSVSSLWTIDQFNSLCFALVLTWQIAALIEL